MTKPYYQDELVTLYHGNCLEVPEWLTADVLVTDPPYGIDYNSGSRRENLAPSILNDKDTKYRDDALKAWGSSRPALMFGTWRIQRPADTKALLVWDTKGALGMGDLRIPWKPAHQEIYVLGDGPWCGSRGSDVISVAPVQSTAKNGRTHPHEKPLRLMDELISKTVGVIADPFAGSGSTLVSATRFGRKAVGVELDERYCELIVKRLAQQAFDFEGIA
jgi:site-specific DNA-methyltransferase (adenine-specific)